MAHRYPLTSRWHFITRWRVKGAAEEVFEILSAPLEYPRWWPSVYLMVREIASGDRGGSGRSVGLLTRGWLPYKLRWQATTTSEVRPPDRIVIQASGDFDGRGIWSIVQDGAYADVTFDWKLTATKPLLRVLSPLFRPAFEANHRWAMEQGQKSLELELARYRSATVEEMNAIPPPATPKELWSRALAAGAVMAAGLIAGLLKTQTSSAPRAS
jgi:uncharacterized protein YndB with AHSA1/START domain